VVINIPLSLLGAVLALWISHQTVNIMTLGGLALAVGILVDEATVAIENIHTHLARGQPLSLAALDATTETAIPRFLAMLCILAVFTPAFFMVGAARALFVPLSLAVGFSMITSFLLSSSLVPILSIWVLRHRGKGGGQEAPQNSPPASDQSHENTAFTRFQNRFASFARRVVRLRWLVVPAYLVVAAAIILVVGRRLGTEIFPRVDAGQFQLRLRAQPGSRIEVTERIATNVLEIVKREVGPENYDVSLGFVGVHPASYPINLIYLWNSGPEEAVLQVQLKKNAPVKIESLKERLRNRLAEAMPDVKFSFEPSDIVSRVMSLGSPTPVEVVVSGPNLAASLEHAQKIREQLLKVPALRDIQFGQTLDYPTVDIGLNRERAGIMNVRMDDASRSLVEVTSSSRFTVPNFWADPNTGVSYQLQVQVPQTKVTSLEDIKNVPIVARGGKAVLLRNIASVANGTTSGEYDRYNGQRTISVTANIAGSTDLGTVSKLVQQAIRNAGEAPPKVSVNVRGQIVPLQGMLDGLRTGLILAVVVIFLLLAANFQSLKLSVIVVSTVPAVIAGAAVALWLTGTTLNIQSFMGAIMAVGVAVANAILLVTFAERSRLGGAAADAAAIEGVRSRLRPILMTSLAMIAGMTPMAIGFGEGGQQAAPLGRAVVGGLVAATLATLFILPSVFALVQKRSTVRSASLSPRDPQSSYFIQPHKQT
ncbi:MAG: mdtC, partial [Pedosphaera sp.]|nr:mdtC [Pedosphaera sp.]